MDPKEPVFVNGRIWKGIVTYDRYKGVGWENGRTAAVELDPHPPPVSEVILVDLRWGYVRKCVRDERDTRWWRAVDLEG